MVTVFPPFTMRLIKKQAPGLDAAGGRVSTMLPDVGSHMVNALVTGTNVSDDVIVIGITETVDAGPVVTSEVAVVKAMVFFPIL